MVAGAGGRVCKHGNRAASSACGAADLLEALGVAIELGPARRGGLRAARPAWGSASRPATTRPCATPGPSRRDLGIPTAFNILGPLSNPARVRRYLIGVADLRMAERMAGVLAAKGAERALIVHGGDGLDELTTTGPSTVVELHDGAITTWTVEPEDLGIPGVDREDLVGGDAAINADLARRVLAGEHGPHRDIVSLNAGAGLLVAGLVDDLSAGIARAHEALDAGAAVAALARLIDVSQREAQQEAGQPG